MTNKLIYTTATVILELFGYKLNVIQGQYSLWRRQLEAKIKATLREVSKLSELEKGKTPKVLKKNSKLSITVALETAKHRLTALAACLRTYTRDLEAQ